MPIKRKDVVEENKDEETKTEETKTEETKDEETKDEEAEEINDETKDVSVSIVNKDSIKKSFVGITRQKQKEINSKLLNMSDVIKNLNKRYGRSREIDNDGKKKKISIPIIGKASDKVFKNVSRIPSSVLSFDYATYGGIPEGRITEFFGMESSSKTTMAMRIIGEAQKMGKLASFQDVEGTFDKSWAKNFMDLDSVLLGTPETGEETLEIVEALIRSGKVDLIVLDSVAAMVPVKEIESSYGDALVGVHARLMNSAMRRWVSAMNYAFREFNTLVSIILINQIRMKIGVMFGSPETTPGGMGMNFAKSLSVKMWRGKNIDDDETKKAMMVDMNFKVTKSKVSPPFIHGTYPMMLKNTAYKRIGDVYDEKQLNQLVKKYGFVRKEKNHVILELQSRDVDLGLIGINDLHGYFLGNPDIAQELRNDLLPFLISL